jgi:hypothetical protein
VSCLWAICIARFRPQRRRRVLAIGLARTTKRIPIFLLRLLSFRRALAKPGGRLSLSSSRAICAMEELNTPSGLRQTLKVMILRLQRCKMAGPALLVRLTRRCSAEADRDVCCANRKEKWQRPNRFLCDVDPSLGSNSNSTYRADAASAGDGKINRCREAAS